MLCSGIRTLVKSISSAGFSTSATAMTLKVYYDALSQPSRALLIFLKHTQLPYEDCPVALRKGEHMTEEYKNINRFKLVPAIDHNGFKLGESVAIFEYLSDFYPDSIPDHWFPKDVQKRARVHEFLAWQHLNLRLYGSSYFRKVTLGMENVPFSLEAVDKLLGKSLKTIDEVFLADGAPFINGADDITVADLLCCCEMEQPMISGYDLPGRYPRLAAYMERVRGRLGPVYDDVHKTAHKLKEKQKASKPRL